MWGAEAHDAELYDYNTDFWETLNFATNASYLLQVEELKAVLRRQYVHMAANAPVAPG